MDQSYHAHRLYVQLLGSQKGQSRLNSERYHRIRRFLVHLGQPLLLKQHVPLNIYVCNIHFRVFDNRIFSRE